MAALVLDPTKAGRSGMVVSTMRAALAALLVLFLYHLCSSYIRVCVAEEAAHAETGASQGCPLIAEQPSCGAQAPIAGSSGATSGVDTPSELQTPAAKRASARDRETDATDLPALEDHQVVEVSSGDAPQAKRSTRSRASESNDSQTQMQGRAHPYEQLAALYLWA